jgi:PAS domain S-box-containing protein
MVVSILNEVTFASQNDDLRSAIYSKEHCQIMDVNAVLPLPPTFDLLFGRFATAVAISRLSDGVFVEANEAFLRLHGYSREEVIGHSSSELHLWNNPEEREQMLVMLRQHGHVHYFAHEYRSKSGHVGSSLVSTEIIDFNGTPHVIGFLTDYAELDEAQEMLFKRERACHTLFDNMLNGLAHCRMLFEHGQPADFIYLKVNKAFVVQTGLENVVGRRASDIIPGISHSDPELLERYGRVAQGGDPEKFEYYLEAMQQWFNVSVYCPAPGEFVSVFDVITERKHTELRLRESEVQYRRLFDLGQAVILIIHPESGAIVDVNAAACNYYGWTRTELLAMRISQINTLPPAEIRQEMQLARAAQKCVFQFQHRRADGSIRDVESSCGPILIDGQELLYSIVSDVTERKQSEAQLRKLYQAVEQSPESIVITSKNGSIEYVNEAFVQNTGYSLEDVLGQNPSILNSGETPAQTYMDLWTTLKRGATWRGEFTNRRKDGSKYTESAIISPIRQGNGDITHYVAVKKDITELKRLNKELDEYRGHLEYLVMKRTRELTDAKEAAEVANRAKSAFLSNMSHEIRTPMNAIVGMTYMLRRSLKAAADLDKLDRIATSADHLLGVINDILDISKIEANKLVLESTTFNLEEVLTRVASMVIERVHEKRLELLIDTDSRLGVVTGDATRLGQALLNYLGNAVKFTEHGTIVLRTQVVEETLTDVLVRFAVNDSGIGIAAEHLPRLFQAFEQADNSTTRRFGGTGLGLAITRRLAELMGGHAGAESIPDVGSTFWFTARLGRTCIGPPDYRIPDLAGKKALVVDDTEITRLLESQLLRMIGLTCEEVSSGAEALERVAEADQDGQPFDVVIMDLHMPDMDGFETFAQLRMASLRHEPVVMLVTASGEPTVLDDARSVGFADALLKPLSLAKLHAHLTPLVSTVLGQRRVAFEESAEQMTSVAEEILQRDYPGTRLLLVDDDQVNCEVALIMLDGLGWEIDIAVNGQEAVDRVANNEYHLILMDMQMPVMEGPEAAQKIRQLPHRSATPILAMTANAFLEDRQACFDAGMNDFISKPVSPNQLFEMLLKWLTKSKTAVL